MVCWTQQRLLLHGLTHRFKQNTNVIELYSRLASNEEQLSYYNSGVGTYAQPSWRSWNYLTQVIDSKIDSAIAWYVSLSLELLEYKSHSN